MASPSTSPIVILGGGFAGLSASKALVGVENVILVDQRSHFEFTPNVHELISGTKQPGDLQLNLQSILRRRRQTFVQGKITQLDPSSKRIHLESGDTLNYELCIFAIGGQSNRSVVPGAEEHSLSITSIQNGMAIRDKAVSLINRPEPSSIALIGAGIEGIEVLGELLRMKKTSSELKIHLIDSNAEILSFFPSDLQQRLKRWCRRCGVHLILGQRVKAVERDCLILENGDEVPSDLTLWTGGVQRHSILSQLVHGMGEKGTTSVKNTLQSSLSPDLFFVGDNMERGGFKDKQAYHAMDMGAVAGENVQRRRLGRSLRVFRPKPKPSAISFGNLDSFLVGSSWTLSGRKWSGVKEMVFRFNMAKLASTSSCSL